MQNLKRRPRYSLTRDKKPLTLQGIMPVVPDGMKFMPDRDYTYCRICGEVYQPELNRVPSEQYTAEVILAAELNRREWSQSHSKLHTSTEHRQLAQSGRHCTPDALQRLVPLGIIPLTDLVLDDESRMAGLEAPRAPHNDVQGA